MSHILIADLFLNLTRSNSLDDDYQFPPETEQFDIFYYFEFEGLHNPNNKRELVFATQSDGPLPLVLV